MHNESKAVLHVFQVTSFYRVPAPTQRHFGGESTRHLVPLSSGLAAVLPPTSTALIKKGGPMTGLFSMTTQT